MAPPTSPDPIGVGIIGFGFMGRTHAHAYANAGDACKLLSICDRAQGGSSGGGNFDTGADDLDLTGVSWFKDGQSLLADERVDLVSVCTHTDTHVEMAVRALASGKHVLVEKPIDLRASEVERLAGAALASDRLCMPAMCMRFWPGWTWLKDAVEENRFGRALSCVFRRLGSRPGWAPHFYADEAQSGGALFDLHVHDADFLVHLFGMPREVYCAGRGIHLTTQYRFDGADAPVHATGEAAWDLTESAGFRMRYEVVFERAVAEFDLSREQPLVVHTEDGSSPVELESHTGYDGEVRALLGAIARGDARPPVTMDDAAGVARLLEAERQSLTSGCVVSTERR